MTYKSPNKSLPSNPPNPFKAFYSLVTKLSDIRAYGDHSYSNRHIVQGSFSLYRLVMATDLEVHCQGDVLALSLPTTDMEKFLHPEKLPFYHYKLGLASVSIS